MSLFERSAVLITPGRSIAEWAATDRGTALDLLWQVFLRHPGRTVSIKLIDGPIITNTVCGVIAELARQNMVAPAGLEPATSSL